MMITQFQCPISSFIVHFRTLHRFLRTLYPVITKVESVVKQNIKIHSSSLPTPIIPPTLVARVLTEIWREETVWRTSVSRTTLTPVRSLVGWKPRGCTSYLHNKQFFKG